MDKKQTSNTITFRYTDSQGNPCSDINGISKAVLIYSAVQQPKEFNVTLNQQPLKICFDSRGKIRNATLDNKTITEKQASEYMVKINHSWNLLNTPEDNLLQTATALLFINNLRPLIMDAPLP